MRYLHDAQMESDDALLVNLAVVENESDEMLVSGELKRVSRVGRVRGGDCICWGVSD